MQQSPPNETRHSPQTDVSP